MAGILDLGVHLQLTSINSVPIFFSPWEVAPAPLHPARLSYALE